MPTQDRNSINHLYLPKEPIEVLVDDHLTNTDLVYIPGNEIPDNSTNVTLVNDSTLRVDSVLRYNSGTTNIGSKLLGFEFTLETWYKVTTPGVHTLLHIPNILKIELDTDNNMLVMTRYIYEDKTEVIRLNFPTELATWSYLSIIRNYNELSIYKDLELVDFSTQFFYDIPKEIIYLGDELNADIANFRLYFRAESRSILTLSLNQLTEIPKSKDNKALADNLIFNIKEHRPKQFQIYPILDLYTEYIPHKECWIVSNAPQNTSKMTDMYGLSLVPDYRATVTCPYTIDFRFKLYGLTKEDRTNIPLLSQFLNTGNKSWLLEYKAEDNNIYFTYVNQLTLVTLAVGYYKPNSIAHIAIVVESNRTRVFFNGVNSLDESVMLVKTNSYQFNYSNYLTDGTGDSYELYDFYVRKGVYYSSDFIPYTCPIKDYYPVYNGTYPYHYLKSSNTVGKIREEFNVLGNSSPTVGQNTTYTISSSVLFPYDVTFKVSIKLHSNDEFTEEDITVPSIVILPAETESVDFNLFIHEYPVNPYKYSFTLVVEHKSRYASLLLVPVDSRELTLDYITNVPGYIDAYFSIDSTLEGNIPNLLNTQTATTLARKVATLYGDCYEILAVEDKINFTEASNVYTLMLVYRENLNIANRGYFGHETQQTFNGGVNQQLIGAVNLPENTYARALLIEGDFGNVKLSGNSQVLAVADYISYRILIYTKDTDGYWSSIPTILNPNLQEAQNLVDCSIDISHDGTKLALGFPEDNNGEGVAQVWSLDNNVWTKEVHISSPYPQPVEGGFGMSVAIEGTGTYLFVSQLGDNLVFAFKKVNTTWQNASMDEILGTDNFGVKLFCSEDGKHLAVGELSNVVNSTLKVYMYSFDNDTFSLVDTITGGSDFYFAKNGDVLAITDNKDYVNVYLGVEGTYSLFESPDYTINRPVEVPDSYGAIRSIAISNNNKILIGCPTVETSYMYTIDDGYTTNKKFQSSSSLMFYSSKINISDDSVVISDYGTFMELFTKDSSAIPQSIIKVRQDYAPAELSDTLQTFEPQILTFNSNLPVKVDNIGHTSNGNSLNGLVFGWLLFDRLLTDTELETIENIIARYLELNKYSMKHNI